MGPLIMKTYHLYSWLLLQYINVPLPLTFIKILSLTHTKTTSFCKEKWKSNVIFRWVNRENLRDYIVHDTLTLLLWVTEILIR